VKATNAGVLTARVAAGEEPKVEKRKSSDVVEAAEKEAGMTPPS